MQRINFVQRLRIFENSPFSSDLHEPIAVKDVQKSLFSLEKGLRYDFKVGQLSISHVLFGMKYLDRKHISAYNLNIKVAAYSE